MTIIANIKGFTLAHPIMIVDNDKVIYTTKASLKDMPELLSHFAQTYNCNHITFVGNQKFAEKMAIQAKEIFKVKYNKENELEIEYITK